MRKLSLIAIFTFSLLSGNDLLSQLVINEVCAANYDDYTGTAGDYEDWFEIYNPTGGDIDIDSYYISDDILNPTKFQIPGSVTVTAGGYAVVYASGRNEISGGSVHTNFKITQGKQEYAVLSNPGGTIMDSWWLDNTNQKNHSFGRISDGDATWGIFNNPTPNGANINPFTSYATTPTLDIDAGNYAGSVDVSISAPGLDIRYTIDGSVPTTGSTSFTGPITINNTTVLRARAFSADLAVLPSFIESNTYFIDVNHSLKVLSIAGDQLTDFINDNAPGAFNSDFEGSMEYFDENLVLIDEGLGDYNKHGNDSWGYDQRGIDFIMRDQYGYNNTITDEIYNLSDKPEFQRMIIKAAANDNYPFSGGAHIRDAYIHELSMRADLKMDERTYEPCIMYVDGQYWGVYEIREKADDIDYTRYYYDQGPGQVDYIKTWGGTWSEFGSGEPDWDALVNYILTNDMTVDANYDYVQGELNTGSLIDYFILNSYVVTSDWLNWNTAWWRGLNPDGDHKKWGYVLWDNDASFGHYINYTGIPTQDPDADPCDPETLGDPGGQGHVPILNKLFENENFYQDYVSRYADLSAGALSCESMHAILDELIARIAPEMPAQVARWGGTIPEWEGNVQEIHDFIDERCDVISEGIVDCYDVEGPFEVTVNIIPPDAGSVQFNTIEITTTPWVGDYFGGLNVSLEANPYGTNVFSNWVLNNHTVFDPNSDTASFMFATGDTITAIFVTTTTDLTIDVQPAGAGSVDFLGVTHNTFPTIIETPESANLPVATSPLGNFFEFDHWELQNNPYTVDPTLSDGTVNVTGPDILTAFYNELPNFSVTVLMEGSDDGVITFDGVILDNLPFTGQFLAGEEYIITADPPDNFHFLYWILNNNILTTDPSISSNSFILNADDILIAVFEEDLNYTLTLQVEPPEAGEILLNALRINELPFSKKFYQADFGINLEADVAEFHDFVTWSSFHHNFGSGAVEPELNFILSATDTITANFYAHPFGFWMPNSFSPNEDGFNDTWKPKGSSVNVEGYEINIYDRSGNILFNSNTFGESWNGDGINNVGYYTKNDIFTYVIKVKSALDGSFHEYTGLINLIR
jgi:gliding motility-associated-like protein